MEALDSPILLSRSLEKCVAAFVAPLSAAYFSNLCPFLHVFTVILDRVTGFKSPDRERFTALFASSISFPDREETRTWSGNTFFLVAECVRGCYILHNA